MQIHASQLPNALESGVYHLNGDDEYWVAESLAKFVSIVGKESLSLHIFDKGETFSEAVGSLFSLSFTDDKSVVLVKDDILGNDVKNHKMLQELLEMDIAPNYLVLVNCSLDVKEKKLVNTINCSKLKEFECVKLAQDFFPYGIEKNALNTLCRYAGYNLLKIKNESDKLIAYCGENRIDAESVELLVAEDADIQIFNFVNSVVTGNNKAALRQLEKLKKRGEPYYGMLAMLINQFRRMLHSAISKKTDDELSEIFKVHKFAIIKARENRLFNVPKLKSALEMLIDYELKFKSGQMSDQIAFDSAIARLIAKEVN